jgi:hypothetical protein
MILKELMLNVSLLHHSILPSFYSLFLFILSPEDSIESSLGPEKISSLHLEGREIFAGNFSKRFAFSGLNLVTTGQYTSIFCILD